MTTEIPKVGDGATICYWTDRRAATVIAVSKTGAKVTIQHDRATRTDTNGMSESQEYTYEPDPNGRIESFRRTKAGRYAQGKSATLVIGHRRTYHDFNF